MNFAIRVLILFSILAGPVRAADHDDGDSEIHSRALNITDIYAFTERTINGSAEYHQLILMMNTGPRAMPKHQYYFSTNARYEFHITRVPTSHRARTPSGVYDVILRLEFSAPDETTRQQNITVTAIRSGESTVSKTSTTSNARILTTPRGLSPVSNTVEIDETDLTVFAGMRQDAAFFDARHMYLVRDSLLSSSGTSLGSGFSPANSAEDVAGGFNVNSIVLRVPRTFVQRSVLHTVFDVWGVITAKGNVL